MDDRFALNLETGNPSLGFLNFGNKARIPTQRLEEIVGLLFHLE